ncbi:carbamate kinase [Cardiobacteriaceae bacterium TAE3-ERU3]|nr:carbamate kinase [Cardiobacteriaceae bacterium TAE3-ERU3]
MTKTVVVAFGGNALIDDSGDTSFPHQYACLTRTAGHIADLKADGWNVLVVHGNGPQVGFSLRRSELAKAEVCPIPIDYAVAESQGAIGFMFQRALNNEMRRRNIDCDVAAVVTQAVVDVDDPAFHAPSKPVGSFLTEAQAKHMQAQFGWTVMEDAGRGWRRCVASPKPKQVVETGMIQRLLARDAIVIAGGGGGIAVSENAHGQLDSLEAVIDKDLTAAILATALQADYLLIPTGVPKVAVRFGQPDQQWLDQLDVAQAQALIEQGEFGKGSMQPKVEALLQYIAACPQGCGVITDPPSMLDALAGRSGTRIQGEPCPSAV